MHGARKLGSEGGSEICGVEIMIRSMKGALNRGHTKGAHTDAHPRNLSHYTPYREQRGKDPITPTPQSVPSSIALGRSTRAPSSSYVTRRPST